MVIRESVNSNLVTHEHAASLHPFLQIFGPIDDRFVPQLGELLYGMTVAQPANVGEVGGNEFGPVAVIPVLWHPRMIDQGQCDIVLAQKVKKRRPEPEFVPDFECKPGALRQFFKERFQPQEKLAGGETSSY